MRRVRVTFWVLVLIAVLATGLVSRALTWDGVSAPIVVTVGAITALLSILLALRILVVTARLRRPGDRGGR